MPSASWLRKSLSAVSVVAASTVVVALAAFKILDRDFWWHITAGRVMWETKSLITVEPFAYTRDGLPYLATHEWLAQIFLYFAHHFGGFTGVIFLRTAALLAVCGLLLLIDVRRIWPNALLVIFTASGIVAGFMDRPQLFTFVLLAAFLALTSRFSEAEDYDESRKRKVQRKILITFVILQVLWVNLHGAAAILGLLFPAALFLQKLYDHLQWRRSGKRSPGREFMMLMLTGIALLFALLISPNGIHTFTYLWSLLSDRTIAFIGEWQPRDTGTYIAATGIFWTAAGFTLLAVRKHWIVWIIILGAMGYLSMRAFRHEMLFGIAASAAVFHQLRHAGLWHRGLTWLGEHPIVAMLASLLLFAATGANANVRYTSLVRADTLAGYGAFSPATDAERFLDKEHIDGKMFNTYGIGGYLIFSGYPDRKVYIDGRNVDYGFDFLWQTYRAGREPIAWNELEQKYGLTYAVIDYAAARELDSIPYSEHLDKNPAWPLVYVDDWTAIYLKDIPMNRPLIEKYRYQLLTATGLEMGTALQGATTPAQGDLVRKELERAALQSPTSVKPRILLAQFSLFQGKYPEAERWAREATELHPYKTEGFAILAQALSEQQKWSEAATALKRTLTLAGNNYPQMNYTYIADVFERAGWTRDAKRYRKKAEVKAKPTPSERTASGTTMPPEKNDPKTESLIQELLEGMAEDLEKYNNEGIAFAEAKKFAEARRAFEMALQVDPGDPRTLTNVCALDYQEAKYDDAVGHCRMALRGDDTNADTHFNLALALWKKEQWKEAKAAAEQAQKLGRDAAALLKAIEASE